VQIASTQATVLAPGSVTRADAHAAGARGGDVRVLSQGAALLAPDSLVTARGGRGGRGGFVEVSGAKKVALRGHVDTSSVDDARGTLLIDPVTLRIVDGPAGSGSVDGSGGYVDSGMGGVDDSITVAEIRNESAFNDIVLQATGEIVFEN
jgi:hypothetical protein